MEEHRIQNIMEDAPVETVAEAPQELEAKPAGVAERFIALLIDWSIISIPYQLLAAFVMAESQSPGLSGTLASACHPGIHPEAPVVIHAGRVFVRFTVWMWK